MKILVNGNPYEGQGPLSLADLLEQTGRGDMLVAVARNHTFIPKAQYGQTVLQEGDSVEIVAPMQGG